MQHQVLQNIPSLQHAPEDSLEQAVDVLIREAGQESYSTHNGERAARAEALAILSHELRRRETQS